MTQFTPSGSIDLSHLILCPHFCWPLRLLFMQQYRMVGNDRISALPDKVLRLVLSFLPAHEAVRTAMLARSWRKIWTKSPALHITGWGCISRFTQFVECLLQFHSAHLESCELDLGSWNFDDGGEKFVMEMDDILMNEWIQRAVRREVRVLRCCFSPYGTIPSLELPDLTLVSNHLSKLELASVALAGDLDLSGCPSLHDLKVKGCDLFCDEILAPYLKHLAMDNCAFFGQTSTRTLIGPQSLISLKLTQCRGNSPVLATMPSLETAIVTFHSYDCHDSCSFSSVDGCGREFCSGCSKKYYMSPIDRTSCIVLNGLSEVTSLELSASPEVVVFRRDLKFPRTFGKLRTLVLTDWFVTSDRSALVWFLDHSPILEKLSLHISKVHRNNMATEGSSKQPELPVACSHLKLVEIKCCAVDVIVIDILKILNSAGVPFEKITIQSSSTGSGCITLKCTGFSTR